MPEIGVPLPRTPWFNFRPNAHRAAALLPAAVAVIAIALPASRGADPAPTESANACAPLQPLKSVATPVQEISLYVGQSSLYDIANSKTPNVSDTNVASVDGTLYGGKSLIHGKGVGVTTVVFADGTSYRVKVVRDPCRFRELEHFIAETFQCSDVKLRETPDTTKIVVTGTVSDARTGEQIIALLTSPQFPCGTVIDRLAVSCPVIEYPSCVGCGRRFR
jgi:hypothetical protein